MMNQLWMTSDVANLIAGMDQAGRGFDGEYGRGWCAACAALARAVGADVPQALTIEASRRECRAFDGIENEPFAAMAFRGLK